MKIGPATLVTAAFIGPGTVTVCTLTGFSHGYTMLWALLLAIVIAVILQEMAARIGVITQAGLGESLRKNLHGLPARITGFGLIISAIVIGNAAYEAGNIAGAALGVDVILPFSTATLKPTNLVIGLGAFFLLFFGGYKSLEKTLIGIVAFMAICFVVTVFMVKPPIALVVVGMFKPTSGPNDILPIIAIVGTTVVPYNLFLHSSSVAKRWKRPEDLRAARIDNLFSIAIGGIISLSIMIVAAASASVISQVGNAGDLAVGLAPLFGDFAKYAIALGLLAAGLSSAITAPLAAAYAVTGLFPNHPPLFRWTWMTILAVGTLFSTFDFNPISIIRFAQVANGLLLPIVVGFVLWLVNHSPVMGKYKNNAWQNTLGFMVLLVTLLLSYRTFNNLLS